jgi:alkaline phosphatase D
VTSENLDDHIGAAPRTTSVDIDRRVIDENPHVRWAELDSHGYILLDVSRAQVRSEWYFVDTVVVPSAGKRSGSAWRVLAGEKRLRPAD